MVLNEGLDFNYVFPVVNTQTSSNPENNVKVYNYDGNIIVDTKLSIGETFTLPPPPTISGMTFDRWVSPCKIIDNTIEVKGNVQVGALYYPTSGATEIDIELTRATGLNVMFNISEYSKIEWGDGTETSWIAGDTTATHTYANYGQYTIEIYGATTISTSFFGNTATTLNYNVKKVRLSNEIIEINPNGFSYCNSVQSISFTSSINQIGENAFYEDYALEFIILPPIINYPSYILRGCEMLKFALLPTTSAALSLITGTFQGTTNLNFIIFPECGVYSIGAQVFRYKGTPFILDFSLVTTIPVISNNAVFTSINAISKIVVPDSLYEEWIASTNWADYAEYIYKASEVF